MNIKIYGKKDCVWCDRALRLLRDERIGYDYETVSDYSEDEITDLIHRANGQRQLPIVFVGDKHIGGYDKLVEYLGEEEL